MNTGECRLPIVAGSNNKGTATASASFGGGDFARALLGVLGKSSEDAGSSDFSAAEDTQAGSAAPEQGTNAKSPQTFATVAQKFYHPGKPATGEAIECPPEKADATVTLTPKAVPQPEEDPGQATSSDFSPAAPVVPGPAPIPQKFEKPAEVASQPAPPDVTGEPIGDFSTLNGGQSLNEPKPTPGNLPVPAAAKQSTPAERPEDPPPVKAQGQASFLPAAVWANPRGIPAWPRSAATAISPAGQKAADVLLGRGKAASYPVNLPGSSLPADPSLPAQPSLPETAIPVATLPAGGKKKEVDTVAAPPANVAGGQPAQPDAGAMASFPAVEAAQPAPGAPAVTPAVTPAVPTGGRGTANIAPAPQLQNQPFAAPEAPVADSVAAFEARLTASEPAVAAPAPSPGNSTAAPAASAVPGKVPAPAVPANLRPIGPASAHSPGVPVKSATGGDETRTTDEAAANHPAAVVGSGQKPNAQNAQKDTADPAPAREPSAAGSVMPAAGTGDFSKAGFRDAATRTQASSGAQPEVPGESTRESAESRPQPLREVSIRITSDTQAADVRMTERNGEIQVAVRASDSNLAHSLRNEVGDLVRGLSPSGLNAEVWHPGSGSQTADSGSSKRESGGQALVEQQDKQEQPSGQQQRKEERRQPGQWPDELD
jgi:hypothetical protein